jgi:hypothetical protein
MSDLITLPRATVKKALEALENSSPDQYPEDAGVFYDAKDALRAALEQQEQPEQELKPLNGLTKEEALAWARGLRIDSPPQPEKDWKRTASP